jgi:hypothetical protein
MEKRSMKPTSALFLAGLWMVTAVPAFAHHAEPLYDLKNPTTVSGVVTRVEWSNPHAYLYVNVKNEKGEVEEWSIELNSPNSLKRNGWISNAVKTGDHVVCTGGRAKIGARTMRAITIELADGKKLKG